MRRLREVDGRWVDLNRLNPWQNLLGELSPTNIPMRYRITFQNLNYGYEVVIFKEVKEEEVQRGTSSIRRKLVSVSNAYAAILEEMKEEHYFKLIRFEEAPPDGNA